MARRDRKLKAYLARHQAGLAGADEDPFAGIPPQLAETHLYGVTNPASYYNGWVNGGSAAAVKVRFDGYSSAHSGPLSIEPAEQPHERIIRQQGLDHFEASLLRDCAVHVHDKLPARARRLGIPERTLRRIRERLRVRGIEGLLREVA